MEAQIEKLQEIVNKKLEYLQKKQPKMKSTISERKKYTRRNQQEDNSGRRMNK